LLAIRTGAADVFLKDFLALGGPKLSNLRHQGLAVGAYVPDALPHRLLELARTRHCFAV
jgi:hypothetical protein